MVTTKLNLSMTEPQVRQIYAKQGDTGRVLDITLDQTPEDGTLRILRPDGTEVTSEANLASDTYNVQTTPYYSGETTDLGMVMGTIEGKSEQDLNGQSEPYPAGGGKNLLNYDAWKTVDVVRGTAVWENNGVTLTATDIDCYTNYGGTFPNDAKIEVREGETITLAWDATPTYIGNAYIFPNAQTSGMVTEHSNVGHLSYTVASGVTYLTFRFEVTNPGVTASYKNIQIVRGTTIPTWSPYSNICPVNSFSTTEFVSEGKNLLDTSTVTVSGITFTQDNEGRLSASPNKSDPRSWGYANSQYKVTLPKGSYTLVVEAVTATSNVNNELFVFSEGGTSLVNMRRPFETVGIKTASLTLTEETSIGVMAKQYDSVYRLMIVASGASTSFEPYQSSTASVPLTLRSLPDGTCDTYENGVVTRRVGVVRLDGTLNYRNPDSSGSCYIDKHDMKRMTNYADSILCDSLKARPSRFMSSYAYGISGYEGAPTTFEGQNWLYFKVDEITTSTDIKEFFTNNPAYAYYPLATPTTETVTIPTLVTYENYTYVHNDSEADPTSIEYKAIMLESGQVAIPSEATEIVGKCYCDIEQNGVSSMPFTLNVKKNERES